MAREENTGMKVTRTIYEGNPFAKEFPPKETQVFASIEQLKLASTPDSGEEVKPLTTWLEIEDGDRKGYCCWLEELIDEKGFHPLARKRETKKLRILNEKAGWVLELPADVILRAGYQFFLPAHNNVPEGRFFVVTSSGVTATAECKKQSEDPLAPSTFKFLTTFLDDHPVA